MLQSFPATARLIIQGVGKGVLFGFALDGGAEQLFFTAKMAVQGLLGDSGQFGDAVHADAFIALFHK